jgi:hypothetical protein
MQASHTCRSRITSATRPNKRCTNKVVAASCAKFNKPWPLQQHPTANHPAKNTALSLQDAVPHIQTQTPSFPSRVCCLHVLHTAHPGTKHAFCNMVWHAFDCTVACLHANKRVWAVVKPPAPVTAQQAAYKQLQVHQQHTRTAPQSHQIASGRPRRLVQQVYTRVAAEQSSTSTPAVAVQC